MSCMPSQKILLSKNVKWAFSRPWPLRQLWQSQQGIESSCHHASAGFFLSSRRLCLPWQKRKKFPGKKPEEKVAMQLHQQGSDCWYGSKGCVQHTRWNPLKLWVHKLLHEFEQLAQSSGKNRLDSDCAEAAFANDKQCFAKPINKFVWCKSNEQKLLWEEIHNKKSHGLTLIEGCESWEICLWPRWSGATFGTRNNNTWKS